MTNPTRERQTRFGDYEVESALANGSMAAVYLGRHVRDGRRVALKVAHASSPTSFEPLRREASLLSRIDIKGISHLLDAGEHDGVPWYAMEYVAGTSLADLWSTPGASAYVDRWMRILARLCQPLMQLHGQGIVHRDLKPQNVVVAEGDYPVIVDFGLSLAYAETSGRDLVVANPAFVGTVAYMSPEQLDGATLDSRSDIYSLGCLMYEAVAGTPPFAGASQEAIQNRLDSVYTPLGYVSDVAPWLSDLVDGMLEKQVGRRIAYLSDVSNVLSANGYRVVPEGAPAKPNLYRPRLAGRDNELKRVRRAARQARSGHGSFMLVGGESGIGKSRLVNEAGRIAVHQRFAIVASSCRAVDVVRFRQGGSPLYPLRELLRAVCDYCMAGGEQAVQDIFGERARVLIPYEDRLSLLPGMQDKPALETVSERAAGERTLSTLTAVLRSYSQKHPLLLAIDDVQWADDMTLEWLAGLGDSFFDGARVLIMATYRSDEMSPALARLRSAPYVAQVPLSRLDAVSVNHMLEDVLATRSALPGELVCKVEQDSEGIPFFVYEYLRAAVESGYLWRNKGNWAYRDLRHPTGSETTALPMPSSVRELLSRRVHSAGDDAFALAQAAAVIGRRFTVDDIVAMTGDSRAYVLDGVLQLERCEVIETDRTAHQFVHDKLRELAYGELEADKARDLHRRRAEAMEQSNPAGGRTTLAAELAFHWIEAGDNGRGLDYLLQGGEYAVSRGAHGDAYRLLSRALTTDARSGYRLTPLQRGRVHQLLGLAAFNTSDLNAAIRHSSEALRSLDQPMPAGYPGWMLYIAGELINLLRGRSRGRPVPYEAVAAREQLALSLLYRGSNLEGVGHLMGAFRSAIDIDAAALTIDPCVRLGFLARTMRLKRVSRRLFDRANRTAQGYDLPAGLGLTLYMEAESHMGLGEWDACEAKAMEAAELFIRLGDAQETEMAWAIGANGLHYAGRLREAEDLGQRIHRSAEDHGHAIHIAWGQLISARSALPRGDAQGAIENLLKARDNIVSEPDLLSMVMTEGTLIKALVALERWQDVSHYTSLLMSKLCSSRKPMVPQCVDGYEGLVDGALALWARDSADARLRAGAWRACRSLGGFVRVFPMAKPVYLRARGQALHIEGRRRGASSSLVRAVDAARRLKTPLWEAAAHTSLASIARDPDARLEHARKAALLQQSLDGADSGRTD